MGEVIGVGQEAGMVTSVGTVGGCGSSGLVASRMSGGDGIILQPGGGGGAIPVGVVVAVVVAPVLVGVDVEVGVVVAVVVEFGVLVTCCCCCQIVFHLEYHSL